MMLLRKLHLVIGFTLAAPLLIQAVTGFLLRAGVFTPTTYGLHTWSLIWKHIASVLAVGLAFVVVSGSILYIDMRVRQFRRRKKAKHATPAS